VLQRNEYNTIEMHLEVCICQDYYSREMNTVLYKCLWRWVYVWKLLFWKCAPEELIQYYRDVSGGLHMSRDSCSVEVLWKNECNPI
jgi:hypothetical protein